MIPSRINKRKVIPRYIIVKTQSTKGENKQTNKQKPLREAREKR